MMNVETAFKIAATEETKLSKIISVARSYYIMNNSDAVGFPYGEVDIQYQSLLEDLELTEREKDIIYINHFFYYAWKVVHISWFKLKEFGNQTETDTTINVYELMKKYGMQKKLLTNGSFTITEKTFYKMSNIK
jgi:hypothetical protein